MYWMCVAICLGITCNWVAFGQNLIISTDDVPRFCPVGTYGSQCARACSDCGLGTCNSTDGHCDCYPGYYGDQCQNRCQEGNYGNQCSLSCNCQNDAKCRTTDGTCMCPSGFTGRYCGQACTDGFFGKNCREQCFCSSGSYCDRFDGCKPRAVTKKIASSTTSQRTTNPLTTTTAGNSQGQGGGQGGGQGQGEGQSQGQGSQNGNEEPTLQEGSPNGLMIAIIAISVGLVIVILLIVLLFLRRMKRLKRDTLTAIYDATANESAAATIGIDNPMYTTLPPPTTTIPPNIYPNPRPRGQLINNLGAPGSASDASGASMAVKSVNMNGPTPSKLPSLDDYDSDTDSIDRIKLSNAEVAGKPRATVPQFDQPLIFVEGISTSDSGQYDGPCTIYHVYETIPHTSRSNTTMPEETNVYDLIGRDGNEAEYAIYQNLDNIAYEKAMNEFTDESTT